MMLQPAAHPRRRGGGLYLKDAGAWVEKNKRETCLIAEMNSTKSESSHEWRSESWTDLKLNQLILKLRVSVGICAWVANDVGVVWRGVLVGQSLSYEQSQMVVHGGA